MPETASGGARTASGDAGRVLIDKYLPSFDVRERHEALVSAEPSRAYAAMRSLDLMRSPAVRALFTIRTLPERWRDGRRGESAPRSRQSFLDAALSAGWIVLEESPGEELVAGAVTRPWEAVVRFRGLPGPQFAAFAEPGFTKIAWSIAAHPAGPGRARVSTETRVAATDAESRRRFRRYWRVFGPFILLIRVLALRRLRRELETSPGGVCGV